MCCCCLGRESIGSIDQSKLDDGNNLLVFSALLLVQTHLLILLFVDSGTRNIRGVVSLRPLLDTALLPDRDGTSSAASSNATEDLVLSCPLATGSRDEDVALYIYPL